MKAALALPPRPITSLPAPPPDVPEFGVAVAAVAPSQSLMQAKFARLCARHPSLKHLATATLPEAPLMVTVQMALAAPVRLPAPSKPAVWLNQPYPVPLPEPGSIGVQQRESPAVAPPEDEADGQPMATLSGAGDLLNRDGDTHAPIYRTAAFDRVPASGWLILAKPKLNLQMC